MVADIWKIKMFGELLRGRDIYLITINYFVTLSPSMSSLHSRDLSAFHGPLPIWAISKKKREFSRKLQGDIG